MLAAIASSKFNNEVILIEKNEKLGKKLFITGKGRCNVTNNADNNEFFNNIIHNSKFIYSAYYNFSNYDFKKLLESNGCTLKVERGDRVFPLSDKSYDITDTLKNIMKKQNVKILLNHNLLKINVDNNEEYKIVNSIVVNDLLTNNKKTMNVDKLIIATGGISYPSTGSTGDGYKFAKLLGIDVINPSPSLVGLISKEQNECKLLAGLTLKNVNIKVYDDKNEKIIYENFGEMTFEEYGFDGPIIISLSSYINFDICKQYKLIIDLKPALTEKQLNQRILREIDDDKHLTIKKLLEKMLPKKMIDIFISRLIIKSNEKVTKDIENNVFSRELRNNIIQLLKSFEFNIVGLRGFDEAIITRGGINVKELDPKTMQSKKVKGLYFAGEVIDVDALTGGFNIQIAASTGYAAGNE